MKRILWLLILLVLLVGCQSNEAVVIVGSQFLTGEVVGNQTIETTPINAEVSFVDPVLEVVIREAIGRPTGTLYQSDLDLVTVIYAPCANITDLSGIEACSNLGYVSLASNGITDLTPLSKLTGETMMIDGRPYTALSLRLTGNQITDLSPLADIIGPDEISLYLGRNMIVDVAPLARLTQLVNLDLSYNLITDASPLDGLHLVNLNLEGNPLGAG